MGKLFVEDKIEIIQGFKYNHKEFSAHLTFLNGEIRFSLPTVVELSLDQHPKCQKG
ncbi:hypothetical protein [Bacillus cereus]|uniref:hypothetical protein n=1 Tax=Bacillus cereus TaxID=1396 RepID=UPI003D96C1A6